MGVSSPILDALYKAVDEVNLALAVESRIEKAPETVLLGPDSTMESIALINLVVEAEFVIQQEFGVELNLGEVRAPDGGPHPFATLGSMAQYIGSQVEAIG